MILGYLSQTEFQSQMGYCLQRISLVFSLFLGLPERILFFYHVVVVVICSMLVEDFGKSFDHFVGVSPEVFYGTVYDVLGAVE